MPGPFTTVQEQVDVTPDAIDRTEYTTCYMCACRCGIRVHFKDDQVRYIDGNPDHPINKGVLCAKGSAGIMNYKSPGRLTKPLIRVGPRGSGEFEEIEWSEAMDLATEWLSDVRKTDPKRLAFFTGRDQSQSLTGWWAGRFGTPNFAAHGGFCSVNMAAGGLYSIGSSFWEFGEPDWERTLYFIMFGVAEDHDSNPIKMGLGRLKSRGAAKFVSVNPVKTGYSAIADEWVGIRPGTDGLFAGAIIHELLAAEKIDWDYLARYTNAPWLVIQAPGTADDGLFARDRDGNPLILDGKTNKLVSALEAGGSPVMSGSVDIAGQRVVPAFHLMAERFLDKSYSPEEAEKACGVPAATIRRIAAEMAHAAFERSIELDVEWTDWAGRKQTKIIGRPVSMHAMRGVSAHSNGFHTCRILHLLQMILGTIDVPGGFRSKPPFPRPVPPGPKPAGHNSETNKPLEGMPLGFPTGPEDLLIDPDGTPKRIDKAYSWEHPLAAHGLMQMVIHNAWKGDPYPIDVLFMYMANMGWNSSMNVPGILHYLTDTNDDGSYKIPKIIYSDAFYSETVPYADLVLPDTTYLERWDCISLLDRPICSAEGPADAIRHPVVPLDRDVRPFQDVLIELGARLKLPGFITADGDAAYPGGYKDYITNHERAPGIGPLAGWRGEFGTDQGRGAPNQGQLQRYIDNGGFWEDPFTESESWMKHGNRDYLTRAHKMGWIPSADRIVMQIYSEPLQKFRLAAQGFGPALPPDHHKKRVETYFDPIPFWYPPFETQATASEFTLHAITQRPMHMYHSWGGQNAWLRQITNQNRLYLHPETAATIDAQDEDWVWIISPQGRVKAQIKTMHGVEKGTIWTWNAIGKRKGAWGLKPGAAETEKGFLLNHIIPELLPAQGDGFRYANA
ncbi:MAG: molybdopterin-dependent oxidoreductase, partial [Alphaproteobacteria bacterium]|nr:molybdopterin-dependent oxidoreductase [Alphaproteobacteria bacterium]